MEFGANKSTFKQTRNKNISTRQQLFNIVWPTLYLYTWATITKIHHECNWLHLLQTNTHKPNSHIITNLTNKKTLKTSYKYRLTQIPLHSKQTLKIHTYYKPKYIKSNTVPQITCFITLINFFPPFIVLAKMAKKSRSTADTDL